MGKTGLIGGVRSLAGIARAEGGEEYYYAVMLNDFRGADNALAFIDKVALAIAASEE